MSTLAEFLLARIAEDEAVAREADVKQGDATWTVHVVALPGGYRVRSGRDARPIAWVEDAAGDDDPTGILNGRAAADHIARHDPARILAECEAKRRIVELHHPDRQLENWYWLERKCAECQHQWHIWTPGKAPTDIGPEKGCPTLRLLALPYAAHPDYRDEWKP